MRYRSHERNRLDSFTLAVIHSSLIGIARDMKILTMRTAYTELWKEQGDLSCCLMDAAGDIIAQDPNGFPIHVTTMPLQLKGMLAAIGVSTLKPGDVLATNDPYIGGTHLPDVPIARPLFHEGELYGYACNRGHWADIAEWARAAIRRPPQTFIRRGSLFRRSSCSRKDA